MSRRVLAASAVTAMLVSLTACSGGGAGDIAAETGGGVTRDVAAPAEDPQYAAGSSDTMRSAGGASTVNRTVVTLRSVIRTGEVSVTSADLDATRRELDDVLTAVGGSLDSERTENNARGRIVHSTITLRVPVDRFAEAMSALQDLGKVQHADSASKDVTTEVIDVAERVETLQRSLDRLQAFQSKAGAIDDLIRYEQEITQREAELQSLKSQQNYLRDQTAMSTITLHLSEPAKPVEPERPLDEAGFVAGVLGGWNALKGTAVVVLTVVGALLPFAAVLGLLGLPLWLVVRRTLRARQAPPTAAATVSVE